MRHFENASFASAWLRDQGASALQTDSRRIQAGDGFIALRGFKQDASVFVDSAFKQGATACLVEKSQELLDPKAWAKERHISPEAIDKMATVSNLSDQVAQIAADFYGNPSQELLLFAVTGTNGKTSTAFWLAQALNALSAKNATNQAIDQAANQAVSPCAVMGTLGVGLPKALHPTGLTTPDPVAVQRHLRNLLQEGAKACAMEASSIGIEQGRLNATEVRVAALTNFTQDHLDYHGSMQNYWQEKVRLFSWAGLQAAVLNIDDAKGLELFSALQKNEAHSELDLWSVSLQGSARLHMHSVYDDGSGLNAWVVEPAQNLKVRVQTSIHGSFNAYNLLVVVACMRAVGVSLEDAVQALQHITPVPGRMDVVAVEVEADTHAQTSAKSISLPLVLVDYAHTPDALQNALSAVRDLVQERSGRLWCVFGCGGDRDTSKRPLMGAIAEKYADTVLVTSDNPRHEAPQAIVDGIVRGMSTSPQVLLERRAAIGQAIQDADAKDVILVAGKGHETYQEVEGVRHAFDDRECAQAFLQQRLQVQLSQSRLGDMA